MWPALLIISFWGCGISVGFLLLFGILKFRFKNFLIKVLYVARHISFLSVGVIFFGIGTCLLVCNAIHKFAVSNR